MGILLEQIAVRADRAAHILSTLDASTPDTPATPGTPDTSATQGRREQLRDALLEISGMIDFQSEYGRAPLSEQDLYDEAIRLANLYPAQGEVVTDTRWALLPDKGPLSRMLNRMNDESLDDMAAQILSLHAKVATKVARGAANAASRAATKVATKAIS